VTSKNIAKHHTLLLCCKIDDVKEGEQTQIKAYNKKTARGIDAENQSKVEKYEIFKRHQNNRSELQTVIEIKFNKISNLNNNNK
jgi:hypothetical protein